MHASYNQCQVATLLGMCCKMSATVQNKFQVLFLEMSYTWPIAGIHDTVRYWNVLCMTCSRYTWHCQVLYTWPIAGSLVAFVNIHACIVNNSNTMQQTRASCVWWVSLLWFWALQLSCCQYNLNLISWCIYGYWGKYVLHNKYKLYKQWRGSSSRTQTPLSKEGWGAWKWVCMWFIDCSRLAPVVYQAKPSLTLQKSVRKSSQQLQVAGQLDSTGTLRSQYAQTNTWSDYLRRAFISFKTPHTLATAG